MSCNAASTYQVDWGIFDSVKFEDKEEKIFDGTKITENTCQNCCSQEIIAIDGENYCNNLMPFSLEIKASSYA